MTSADRAPRLIARPPLFQHHPRVRVVSRRDGTHTLGFLTLAEALRAHGVRPTALPPAIPMGRPSTGRAPAGSIRCARGTTAQ
jgi:hypothetical protein